MTAEARVAVVLGVWAIVVLTRPAYVSGYFAAYVSAALLVLLAVVGRRMYWPPPAVIALAGLAWASYGWSQLPTATISGAVLITLSCFSGAAVARALPCDVFLRLADWTFRAIVSISVALALVRPDLGIEGSGPTAGSLVGIYPTRNVFGYVLVLGAVFLFVGRAHLGTKVLVGMTYLGALLWTGSQTSLLAFVLALSVSVVTARLKNGAASARAAALSLGASVFAAAAMILVQERSMFAASLGRDLSFSGRTDIWSLTVALADQRPWLGWGYGTGFTQYSSTGQTYQALLGWTPPTAHNGFLNLYLELGIVGALLAGGVLLATVVRTLRALARREVPEAAPLATTVLAVLICVDLMETRMFVAVGLFLMTYLGVALTDRPQGHTNQVFERGRPSTDS